MSPVYEPGASTKPVKRRWTGKCEFPLTEEYERGHAATFGEKADRYCEGCGRLRVWCECPEGIPGARVVGIDEVVAAMVNPHHGFYDKDGKYHPAPGCNVIVTGLEP